VNQRKGREVVGTRKVVYYARCEGIRRMGPYPTELRAWQALKSLSGDPVKGAIVWPEEPSPRVRQIEVK
jgi:hypothetical protein